MVSWKEIQKKSFFDWKKLFSFLHMDPKWGKKVDTKSPFSLCIPLRLAKKITPGDFYDPILQQFLPLLDERKKKKGFVQDPVQDLSFIKNQVLHKYSKRALLLCPSQCAMHCRFCFRKFFPYSATHFTSELAQIKNDPSIEEIILSGGDPLALDDKEFFPLLSSLEKISHIQRIRIHTRFIIGIPERISPSFLQKLSQRKKTLFIVLHTNHPKEIDKDVQIAIQKLSHQGIPILSQTVLLKGINDSFSTLQDLFTTLINIGVIPYYLHHLDKVEGSHRFYVPMARGKALIRKLQEEMPGYGVPRYVEEIPHKKSKTVIL